MMNSKGGAHSLVEVLCQHCPGGKPQDVESGLLCPDLAPPETQSAPLPLRHPARQVSAVQENSRSLLRELHETLWAKMQGF
jgi:hypothetical protein